MEEDIIASDIVFPFSPTALKSHFGNSYQAQYLIRYLSDLNAKTCVYEEEYIDRDYIIDYQKFYSRSFENHKRFTKRVHFFTVDFSAAKF
jgi:hypothetical protein